MIADHAAINAAALMQSYRGLFEQVARAITADVLVYHIFDPAGARMTVRCGFNLPTDFRITCRPAGRICHHEFILAGKTASLHADVPITAFWKSDPDLKRYNWRSYLAAAVKANGQPHGSVAAFSSRSNTFHVEQVHVLEMAAAVIAITEEHSALREQLRAHERRERLVTAVCREVDGPSALNDCLAQCLGIIGQSCASDAVSLYRCTGPSTYIRLPGHWAAPERQSLELDAHVGAIALLPNVAAQLEGNRLFCWDAELSPTDRRLSKRLRALKTSSLVLLAIDTTHAPRILCAIQDAGLPRRWDRQDLIVLVAAMRVIAHRLEAHETARRLDEVENLNSQMVQLSPTAIYRIDLANRRFISINEHMCQATGYAREELLGMDPIDLLAPESQQLFKQRLMDMAAGRTLSSNIEFQLRTKSGALEWGHFHIRHLYTDGGRIRGANVVAHIITEQKQAQEELAKYGRQLEALVEARTSELSQSNLQLRKEIERHTQTAAELRKQSERLTEMNTAMRVLLDKRNEERIRTEENIRLTLKELIEPYLLRLETSGLALGQRQLIELIRMNLEEVVGSSLPEISSAFLYFSPSELQIVNLIRKGKSTKEIATLLNISPRTVEAYRNNVRKKLGLKNRKVNLRTYLSSFK
jgi:PAS domain S-box-containing protein